VIADGLGRAVAFILAPGQAHELPQAVPLLERLPGIPQWVVADRGFSSHAFREHIWERGARPAIPSKQNEAPVACPEWIYTNRNQVERLWARLKEWRAIATRYEKTASSFMGILCLAAALDWLKSEQALKHGRDADKTIVGENRSQDLQHHSYKTQRWKVAFKKARATGPSRPFRLLPAACGHLPSVISGVKCWSACL